MDKVQLVTDYLPIGVSIANVTPTATTILSQSVSWSVSTLSPGSHRDFDIVVQVDPDRRGKLVNSAEVKSGIPDSMLQNNQVTITTGINEAADLVVDFNRDPSLVVAGKLLTYTLAVLNRGPSSAFDVSVNYLIPDSAPIENATPCPQGGRSGTITWSIPEIRPGERRECQVTLRVASDSTGRLSIVAWVLSTTPDHHPENNGVADSPFVFTIADLAVKKLGDKDRVLPGDILEYTIVLTNTGPSDAHNVTITDTLPFGVVYLSATPEPTIYANPLRWYTSTMTAGSTWTINLRAKVRPDARGILKNLVRVGSNVSDDDSTNSIDEQWAKAPVIVTNAATACEGGLWCQESNLYMSTPFKIYLPLLLKAK